MINIIKIVLSNWKDILSVIHSEYEKNKIAKKEKGEQQKLIYEEIQQLLEYECNYFSSEQKLMRCYQPVNSLSPNEVDEIKRKVRKYFGEKQYIKLCEILELCDQAQIRDYNIGKIFESIKDSEVYSELRRVLMEIGSHADMSIPENIQQFLRTISFTQYESNGCIKTYDYIEESEKLSVIDKQIYVKRKNFEDSLKNIMEEFI